MSGVWNELSEALRVLEITQGELSMRLRVHRNTVNGWATGRVEMPGPVKAYLELAIRAKELAS